MSSYDTYIAKQANLFDYVVEGAHLAARVVPYAFAGGLLDRPETSIRVPRFDTTRSVPYEVAHPYAHMLSRTVRPGALGMAGGMLAGSAVLAAGPSLPPSAAYFHPVAGAAGFAYGLRQAANEHSQAVVDLEGMVNGRPLT